MSQRHIRISVHLEFTRFMKLYLGAEHLYQVPELGHYKSQARGQAGWILAKLSFCVFMVRDESSRPLKIHAAIYISSPISSYLDRNSLDNNGSIIRHHAFMSLSAFTFVFAARMYSWNLTFSFSLFSFSLTRSNFSFSSSFQTEKSQKIFCERKLSCTHLDFGEVFLREQNGQSRASSVASSYPLG